MKKIPLTVVGGFLGSGKTTLLNNLLQTTSGRRIAVLVNDFGPINIDTQLIAKHEGETISLTNGCICCSIGSGLDAALIDVLSRDPQPDWVVIESSGVSDPAPIASVGLTEPSLKLAGVVTVIDAEQIQTQAADPLLHDTIAAQIKGADLLILNKTDLLQAEPLAECRTFIKQRYGAIPTYETTQGRVAEELLFEIDDTPVLAREGAMEHPPVSDHPFETALWTGQGVLSADELMAYFRQLPRGVFRAKGFVCTDYHGWVSIQFAGRRLQFIAVNDVDAAGLDQNQIVFIQAPDAVDLTTLATDLDQLVVASNE